MNKIGFDKILHFAAGFAIGLLGVLIAEVLTTAGIAGKVSAAIIVTALPVIAGIVKEWRDAKQPKNRFDVADMIATWIGGAVVFVPVWIMIILK